MDKYRKYKSKSLSIITIVTDKGSYHNQALSKSGQVMGLRLTFTKLKSKISSDRPYTQTQGRVTTNNFLSPV